MPKKVELKIANGSTAYSLQDTCPFCGIYEPEGAVCNSCKMAYGFIDSNSEMTELLKCSINTEV